MKILSDDKISLIHELFGSHAEIRCKPGTQITAADLKDSDILLVRTVTQVNRALLDNTAVRFVGTATTGIDHLDTQYLEKAGIRWFSAKGANAKAVVNYVQACLALLQQAKLIPAKPSLGIIGAGVIGSLVATTLQPFCSEILLNDPPRAALEHDFDSRPLHELTQADVITLHTPLTKTGPFPTYHLIDQDFLTKLKTRSVIINTARGGIIDEAALLQLKRLPVLCLDVWENEPDINLDLMPHCFVATPHIAGYSTDAKNRASLMLYHALAEVLDWPAASEALNKATPQHFRSTTEILEFYNPAEESTQMKSTLLSKPKTRQAFEDLRRNYRLREEF